MKRWLMCSGSRLSVICAGPLSRVSVREMSCRGIGNRESGIGNCGNGALCGIQYGEQLVDLVLPRQLRHRGRANLGALAGEGAVIVQALEQRDDLIDAALAPAIDARV